MTSAPASESDIVAAATAYYSKQMEALQVARETGDRVTEDNIMYNLRKEHMTGCIAKHIMNAAESVVEAEKKYEEAIDEFDQAKGMLKYLCSVHRDAFD
jgi:hemoglobin-like flavoprotein